MLGLANPGQIVTTIYSPEFTRTKIASLAPEILKVCAEVPETGDQLLAPAGAALAEMISAVAQSLGWTSGLLPLAIAGGFLLSAKLVRQRMIDQLMQQGYQLDITSVTDPVRGALVLAEQALKLPHFPNRTAKTKSS